jgi:hypothetical protein
VIHVAHGRLRLRVTAMRRNASFFATLASSMESVAAVGNVHASCITGTMLIEGTTLTVEEFRELARRHSWLDIDTSPLRTEQPGAEASLLPAGPELMGAAPLLVLTLAAIQGARGHLLPSALSLLLRAIQMGRPQTTGLR